MAKYQRHSETSREAADRAEPRAGTQRRKVLDYLRQVKQATDERQQDDLRMNASTQRPRRIELVDMGLVRDSGHTALTKSGRLAVLWEIVPVDANSAQSNLFERPPYPD